MNLNESFHELGNRPSKPGRVLRSTPRGADRVGFATAFSLYFLIWLAVPLPVTLMGSAGAQEEWYRWLLSFDVLVAWWLLPSLSLTLLRGPLDRLDVSLERSSLGSWANRVVRYGLPLHARQWHVESSLVLFLAGALSSLLLFKVGAVVTLFPEGWRGQYIGLPLLFALSVPLVMGVASLFVPEPARRRELDFALARLLDQRYGRLQPMRIQTARDWIRVTGMLVGALLIISLIVTGTLFYSSYEVQEIREMLAQ